MLASPLPTSFLDRYKLYHDSRIRTCAWSSIFLSFGQFVWVPLLSILRVVRSILQVSLCSIHFFLGKSFFFVFFLKKKKNSYLVFSFISLFEGFGFQYSWVFVIFLLWKRYVTVLISSSISLSSAFIISEAYFLVPNSIPFLYNLTVSLRDRSSFSFVANIVILSIYIKWFIFFCDLMKF